MVFQNYILDVIKDAWRRDHEFRRFYGRKEPFIIEREDIEAYQSYKLKKTWEYATSKSVFYKKFKSGVPEIKSIHDISRLPFTSPENLAENPYQMLCISLGNIARIFSHTTTGTTTGKLKKIFFTGYDVDAITDSMTVIMKTVFASAGLNPERVVQIFLPDNGPPLSMARMIAKAVGKMGGTPVIGDCSAPTEEQIDSIRKTRPDMIMGSAFRIWRMTQEASLKHDLSKLGVKAIFITSEYLSAPMRNRMTEQWQGEVFHHYGMTEPGFAIGVECGAHDGFHFNEADLFYEVVDPESGRVLDGEEGELVLTTLNRQGLPLIRYRTGDIARLIKTTCSCGATVLTRIGKVCKRKALISKIGESRELFSSMLDEALYQIPELIDYRVFLNRHNGRESIDCKVELTTNGNEIQEAVIRRLLSIPSIKRSVEKDLLTRPNIIIVGRGVLRRGGRTQKRRIVDNR